MTKTEASCIKYISNGIGSKYRKKYDDRMIKVTIASLKERYEEYDRDKFKKALEGLISELKRIKEVAGRRHNEIVFRIINYCGLVYFKQKIGDIMRDGRVDEINKNIKKIDKARKLITGSYEAIYALGSLKNPGDDERIKEYKFGFLGVDPFGKNIIGWTEYIEWLNEILEKITWEASVIKSISKLFEYKLGSVTKGNRSKRSKKLYDADGILEEVYFILREQDVPKNDIIEFICNIKAVFLVKMEGKKNHKYYPIAYKDSVKSKVRRWERERK